MAELIMPIVNYKTASTAGFSTASASFVDVLTLASITTTGSPVSVFMNNGYFHLDSATTTLEAEVRLRRDSTTIWSSLISLDDLGAGVNNFRFSCSAFRFEEMSLAAGSYIYKFQARLITGSTISFSDIELVAREFSWR